MTRTGSNTTAEDVGMCGTGCTGTLDLSAANVNFIKPSTFDHGVNITTLLLGKNDFTALPRGVSLAPSTLNPQPSTLNPQPSTLNPQPSTLNPQP